MTAFPDIILLRSGRRRRRLSVRTPLAHPFAPMLAHLLPGRPAFVSRNISVAVGVKAGKGFIGLGLHLGDHHRTTIGPVTSALMGHVATATALSATALTAAAFAAFAASAIPGSFAAGGMGTVKLTAADGTVAVGIQTAEAGVVALGAMGLHGRPALLGRHRAIPVGVGGGQALDALLHEFRLADAAIGIGVGTGMSLRCTGRRLLRQGDTTGCGGESQGGKATQHESLLHNVQSPETAELAVAVFPV